MPTTTVILDRGDYTSLTINLFGGIVTSWRIQNREQLFVSRIAAFSQLTRLWGGIGLSFPHFHKWNFGPNDGFAKNMKWLVQTAPQYLENGDVWASFCLKDNNYTKSFWNFKFKIYFTVTLHEFKITFDITFENYDDNFSFDFFFTHYAFFRTPDTSNSKIEGLKDTFYRQNKKDEYIFDEADILNQETADSINITAETDIVYTKVFNPVVINHLVDNAKLKIISEGANDLKLWNPWKNHKVLFVDADEYAYLVSPSFGTILKPVKLLPKSSYKTRIVYEITLDRKILEDIKHFYDYFKDYC